MPLLYYITYRVEERLMTERDHTGRVVFHFLSEVLVSFELIHHAIH